MQVEALSRKRRFDLGHLVRRFFGTILAQPLSPAEQRLVADRLGTAAARLFWAQSAADQRHAFETMRRVAIHTTDAVVLRTALLHDVGKAHTTLGAVGRSLATVLDAVGAPLLPAMAAYRDHGRLGAEALARIGADPLTIDFARRHPDPDPGAQSPAAWAVLLEADQV